MNKENPKKNKKSFEYYIAQRKEEFRCQYDHERSWENLQYTISYFFSNLYILLTSVLLS